MQVVVLIGGAGTRLYPLTYTTPKCLLPIANRTFLRLLLGWLRRNGVSQVVFAVGHLATAITEALKTENVETALPVVISHEDQPLGSAGALANGADLLEREFILLNGDILMDLNLRDMMAFHRKSRALVTATVNAVDDPTQYGILHLEEDGRTREWQEKPTREAAKSNWGNVGAWAMNRDILEFIPKGRFTSLEKETFPQILGRGLRFFGYRFGGYWKDIGTVDKYVQANNDLLARRIQDTVPPGKAIRPGVWAEDESVLPADLTVAGPVVLGKNCRIGAGVRISGPAVIGSDVTIGDGADLASVIAWSGARIGAGARVCESVIAAAEIGAGCVLKAGCAVASNSVVGEGVTLPASTRLGPGTRLHLDRETPVV